MVKRTFLSNARCSYPTRRLLGWLVICLLLHLAVERPRFRQPKLHGLNLARTVAWFDGKLRAKTRVSRFARLAA